MISKADLLQKCLTQTEIYNSSLGEIKLRQLTIAESEEVGKIQQDETKTLKDVMFHSLKCAMVDPEFFTQEELSQLGQKGTLFINEVFSRIPRIGMSDEESKEYDKKIEEFLKKDKKEEETEDEAKKK